MPGTVAGVASERDILVLQAMANPERLVELLDECGVSGKQLHVTTIGTAADAATLVISRDNLHNEDRLRKELTAVFGDRARVADGLGALSVVGAGINATYANVRRGSKCLHEHGIVSQGLSTSSFRTTWLVERSRLDDAVRLMHAEFLENDSWRTARQKCRKTLLIVD